MQLALPMPYSGCQLASASPTESCMLVVFDSSLASTIQSKLLQCTQHGFTLSELFQMLFDAFAMFDVDKLTLQPKL